jgi:response regulator of citrate/malate metabolism
MKKAYKYPHILIIDDSGADNLHLRNLIISLNQLRHFTVFENAVLAFNYLRRNDPEFPDLIFIGLFMPGMGGFQFIERFNREFTQETKFIITTASQNSSYIKMASNFSNVINYFIKPVCKPDLINIGL